MKTTLKSILLIFIILLLLLINVPKLNNKFVNSNYVRKIDNMTISYIDSSINKAIIAFTSARGINAIISMLKSSTVNLTPAGVGASISIGQVLDPVDDIIENLSNILLLSIVSLGIQRFLIEIAPFISFNIFLNLGLILLFFLIIIKNLRKSFLFNLAIKFFIVALVIEFILPFFVFIDWTTNKLFFEKEYESARYTLNETNEELTATYGAIFSTKGVIEGFKNFLKKENNGKNFIEQLKDSAEKIIESSLKLILIFILDTVIIPLFFLWLLYKFLKYIFNYNYLLKKP